MQMEPVSASERPRQRELAAILDRFPLQRDLIVFAPSIGWDPPFLFQRPQQLARAFARDGCLVFYVEPEYPQRRPEGFHEDREGLYVSCVPLSVFSSLSSPAVVVFPYNTEALRYFRNPRVIYEYLDSLELWGGGPELTQAHRETIARATVVTATAQSLLAEISGWRPDALYSPNAADYGHFAPGIVPRDLPADLAEIKRSARPLIGYTGALASWFDYELLGSAAAKNPEADFVLIGSDHDGSLAKSGLLETANVHWLGAKPYEDLPAYVEALDAAIIPFVVDKVTASTSPVKLFEYFAAEKPVVSTALPECLATPLVLCAHGPEEFSALLLEALAKKDDPDFRSAAASLARENSWELRAAAILEALSHPLVESVPDWRLSEALTSLSRAESEVTRLAATLSTKEKDFFARIEGYEHAVQGFIRQADEREEVIRSFSRQAEDREAIVRAFEKQSQDREALLAQVQSTLVQTQSALVQTQAAFDAANKLAAEREEAIQQLTAEYQSQAREQERTIQHLTISLNSITTSRGWRALQRLWQFRLAIAPYGSRRERVFLRSLASAGFAKGSAAPQLPPEPQAAPSTQPEPAPRGPEASPAPEPQPASPPEAPVAIPVLPQPTPSTAEVKRRPVMMEKPRVAYLTNQLLDWFTREPRFGGGERYCITLAALLKDHGFEVTFFQAASTAFEGEYYGTPVVGIPLGPSHSEFQYGVCDAFYEVSKRYDRVIHNLPEYASGKVWSDALLMCHGIWFDHDNYGPPISFRTPEWYRHLSLAFSQPGHVVSVDTNSINVIRALWPELTKKMTYIPNWVDLDRFHPAPGQETSKTILFPRRSQVNRGSRILEDILKAVPHQDWKFLWVGEGDAVDTQLIKDLTLRDSRLQYRAASFEEMAGYYQSADICVIPTIACEGTSLSCLEALASGNAVISTNVGGLPDLVQPQINGLLVDPNPEDIASAINFLIENPSERERLRKKAVESAEHFRLEVWRERWTVLLKKIGWLPGAQEKTAP